ncbi:MAG: hypothetical protein WAN65_15535 [Candidatus Sulfotelmatobacter sp.]
MSEQQPLSLPSPEPTPTDQPQPEAQAQSGGKARRRIPSAEECLELLGKLSGLVILGVIRTNQATAIRGALRDILAYHQRSTGGSQAGAGVDSRLLEMLPNHPELMNLLTPFFSDEQVALLMKGATDGNQPQTRLLHVARPLAAAVDPV